MRPFILRTSTAALTVGLFLIAVCQARAFENDECSDIVTTSQHRRIDLRPGETPEIAHVRAIDEVGRLAVAEVIGIAIDSSQSVSSDLNNEADTRHTREVGSPGSAETGLDRSGVKLRLQDVAQYNYRGLVRVKLLSEAVDGPAGHQSLELAAEVMVCRPKRKDLMVADRRPPQVVDPDKASWFSPVTGEPQLWYWAGPGETFTFFDKAGFDPGTGDPLKRVDRQFQGYWRALMAKRRKDALDTAERQQREAALSQERAAAAKQASDLRATQDAQHIQSCDAGTANPNDPRKPASVTGAAWDTLRSRAATAIPDCEAAIRLQPGEMRFRYQLARAYSVDDPKRALLLFKRLCDERYPAAYDNYGWGLLDRRVGRNDFAGATRAFEAGVAAGDSDAMVSLAGFMRRGSYNEAGSEDALALYRRAAKLGNSDAVTAIEQMEAEQVRTEATKASQVEQMRQQAIRQEEAGRMVLGIVGGAMNRFKR